MHPFWITQRSYLSLQSSGLTLVSNSPHFKAAVLPVFWIVASFLGLPVGFPSATGFIPNSPSLCLYHPLYSQTNLSYSAIVGFAKEPLYRVALCQDTGHLHLATMFCLLRAARTEHKISLICRKTLRQFFHYFIYLFKLKYYGSKHFPSIISVLQLQCCSYSLWTRSSYSTLKSKHLKHDVFVADPFGCNNK